LFVNVVKSQGYFWVFHLKNKKAVDVHLICVSHYAVFRWGVWLAPTVVTVILLHHLIRLSVLFYEWRVYGGLAWFDLKLLLFFSFSYFFGLRVGHAKIHTSLLIVFIQSLFSYLQLFYLHWLFLIGFYFWFHPWIVSNWILFLISSLII